MGDAPQVRLGQDLLATAPEVRAWTLAHEAAHVLRGQQRLVPPVPVGVWCSGAVLVVVMLVALAAAVYGERLGGWAGGWVTSLLLVVVAAMVMWAGLLTGLLRAEEAAADAVAATVFGEVLSEDGVRRLYDQEGLTRYQPMLLRTHPRPPARRQAGLTALAAAVDTSADRADPPPRR